MLKEIGSEFWDVEVGSTKGIQQNNKDILVLSGRTALDLIIQDLKARDKYLTVYLPAYCCESMISPFIHRGFKVIFYDVQFDEENRGLKFNIDLNKSFDVILLMQYYGYQDNTVESIAKLCSDKNIIIIEDITHSLLSEHVHSNYADYIFGSIRKWTGLYSGAFVKKIKGQFLVDIPTQTNEKYCSLRKSGMELKKIYIELGEGNKNTFLRTLNQAESLLEKDYINYLIDKDSIEDLKNLKIEWIKERRRENAKQILSSISDLKWITPMFSQVREGDTPLFVPVLIKNGERDKFRKYLIEKSIYCPIHWGISELHNISQKSKEIYNNVLSIVCDQRYDENELAYLIKIIREFEEC